MNDYTPVRSEDYLFKCPQIARCSRYRVLFSKTDSERRMCDVLNQQQGSFPHRINRSYLFIYSLLTRDRFTSHCCTDSRMSSIATISRSKNSCWRIIQGRGDPRIVNADRHLQRRLKKSVYCILCFFRNRERMCHRDSPRFSIRCAVA